MSENLEVIREKISEKLKEAGYKLTPQRAVTVATLLENQTKLLTAEEIFMAVKIKNPAIGLATVYRTLDLLDELSIVNKKQFHDGLTRYDVFISSNKIQPYYLVCSNCGKMQEIKGDMFSDISSYVQTKYQFIVKVHDVTFHGICDICQKGERL